MTERNTLTLKVLKHKTKLLKQKSYTFKHSKIQIHKEVMLQDNLYSQWCGSAATQHVMQHKAESYITILQKHKDIDASEEGALANNATRKRITEVRTKTRPEADLFLFGAEPQANQF